MKHGNLAIGIATLGLVGCGLLQVNGKPLDLGSGSGSSGEDTSTSEGKQQATSKDYVPPPEAKERFEQCGAKIEESQKLWSEQEQKTRAAITASEQAGLYDGWLGLMNQYRDNCMVRKKLGNTLSSKVTKSTAIELSLAVARFQIRHGLVHRSPLTIGDEKTDVATWVPMGQDASFDHAEWCRPIGANIDFLTTDEFNTWKGKHDPQVKKQAQVIDDLFAALNGAREKIGADRGKVKKAQKQPDGSVRLTLANLYGGSECVHSGQWRFNGTFWTDCDYVGAKEQEFYPFTVTFKAERVPKQGLQVGDVIQFWGLTVKPGPDDKHPKEGADYEGIMVTDQMRGTKSLLEVPTFERPMNCVRVD